MTGESLIQPDWPESFTKRTLCAPNLFLRNSYRFYTSRVKNFLCGKKASNNVVSNVVLCIVFHILNILKKATRFQFLGKQ